MSSVVQDAEIIVIGGGAVGAGVACRLAEAGKTDVLVIEREPSLASVTTAQAAGLVGQVRSTADRTRLAMESVRVFSGLQGETGVDAGWRPVGSLRLALVDERVAEFERLRDVADRCGLEVEFLDSAAARRRWPALRFNSVKAALWCPTDGYLQPNDLTMAYAARARQLGARFATGTGVREVLVERGRVTGVATDRGTVRCEIVINAAGAHAFHVARQVGLELPIIPVRHEYFVSVPIAGIVPDLPVLRIPDATLYVRAEVNSLLVGGWECESLAADPRTFRFDDPAPGIEPDWDVLARFGTELEPLYPGVRDLGIRSVFKGWPTFTPDGRFIIGESRRVRGFVMAGGCNAHGVSGSAGIGKLVVESLLDPDPSPYVKSLSPDRFTEQRLDWWEARRRAQRVYERYYAIDS